jgi:drug/metabolite transporter (DMT)-like permease
VAAFVVLGERPSAGQWAGVLVTAAGVVLASVRRDGSALHLAGLGPVFGAAGVVLGSVANAIVRDPVRELGPLPAIVTQRTFTIVVLALVVAVALWRSPRLRAAVRRSATRAPIDRRLLALLGLLGLLDALAFLAFAYALLDAPAWLVGLVSQSGRALAVVGGVVLFHERLDRIQWTGVATLGAGLVVLSVFSAGI